MPRRAADGLTLVELLISLGLLGMVMISVFMLSAKLNLNIASFSNRNRALIELDSLYGTLRDQLQNATWIDPTSYKDQIIFTTRDNSGNYTNIGYRITTSGTRKILQYSANGGTTWQSPYNLSADTTYKLGSSSEFLFCGFQNNCTRFTDTSGNGSWAAAEGDTATLVSGTGSALSKPSDANKIRLSAFSFDRAGGNPSVNRVWPDTTIHMNTAQVAANTAPAPDSANQNAFSVQNTADFQANFNVRGVTYDPDGRRLLIAGYDTVSATKYLYITSRDGVRTLSSISLNSFSTVQYDDVCLMPDGVTAILANFSSAPFQVLVLSTSTGTGSMLSLSTASTGLSTASAIACDPSDSSNFYLAGKTSGSVTQIKQISTSGTVGTSWSPSGISNTVTAMVISPASSGSGGDFYLLNSALTTGPPKTMTMVRIDRSAPASPDSFTINLTNIGTPTTSGTASSWGLAYDPATNHMFLSDETADKIYEFIPPRLLAK